MINISKLYCDQVTPGDWLRYGRKGSGECEDEIVPRKASERRPIVVWNITRACNLKCVHCYNDSGACKAYDEVSTDEAKAVLDDLALADDEQEIVERLKVTSTYQSYAQRKRAQFGC